MKNLRIVFAALAVAFLTASFATAIQAADAPKEPVMIDDCQAKKPPVAFDHSSHVGQEGVSCKTCHHTGDVQKACADCHKEPQGELGACTEMSMKKNPFHARCIDCHKEKAKGPTKCNDCHKK